MIDTGIFELKTPAQLFLKLLLDYEHLKNRPDDSYGWFNFVVTADHLPEWESDADEKAANELRMQEPLLLICNHLARNAKHFKAKDLRKVGRSVVVNAITHTTDMRVQTLNGGGDRVRDSYSTPPSAHSAPGHVVLGFELELSEKEARELGMPRIAALDFAALVVEFWRRRLNLPT